MLEFFASCLGGLEKLLADELKTFGIKRVRPLSGGVAFFCSVEQAYRACLWSRLASRIMLVLDRVDAHDAELLYAGAYEIPWEEVLAADISLAVRASGTNANLRNTRFTSFKVKDAVADRLRAKHAGHGEHAGREEHAEYSGRAGREEYAEHEGRVGHGGVTNNGTNKEALRCAIDVRIRNERATISLDFSGEALNHRVYLSSEDGPEAAFNASKAAGLLAMAGWTSDVAADFAYTFADPACRDGIVVMEAASIACDRANGLGRERWGFFGWAEHDDALWQNLLDEASARFDAGLLRACGLTSEQAASSSPPDSRQVHFFGATASSPQITKARARARRAGLRQVVSIERGSEAVRNFVKTQSRALLIASDLDVQARADAPADALSDETAFVSACTAAPEGSRFAASGGSDLAARFAAAPYVRATVGKGRVETVVEVFDEAPAGGTAVEVADLSGGAPHVVEVLESASEQFAARLRKVFKERRKWAARECVSCYRIYDADLPDYALAIDWYAGAGDVAGNDYLHIAEYAPPSSVDEGKARRRFNDALALAPIVCGVRPDHVFSKRRVREKGGGQYRNAGTRSYVTTIEEGGFLFEVDLAARLDTGIFLDHRMTRELVRKAARGVKFLNLFAYTGTASVYAAGGGAVSTTTVDLSQTYIDWAQRNMAANDFTGREHSFERADVLRWMVQARRARKRYDLIFVDPPTFSNSKAMGKKTWDVQRDHVELLIGVAHLLAPRGQAIFSCNLRNFKPNLEELAKHGIELEDNSLDTIPQDFARTPKIHKCYRVRKS